MKIGGSALRPALPVGPLLVGTLLLLASFSCVPGELPRTPVRTSAAPALPSAPADGAAAPLRPPAAEPPRQAADRQAPAGEPLRFDADTEGTLAASVYSFPSDFFTADEAAPLLAAVLRLDPRRELLVLTDLPAGTLRERLAGAVPAGSAPSEPSTLNLLGTRGAGYSPWPRDPFSLVRGANGRVVVLLRPNLQPGREADARLGLELVEDLPPRLDAAWGGVRWARATVPFHNGQVLLAPGEAWISLHTLEPRILSILGLERVPVATFATAAGIDRYLAGAERARAELEALYGRPVRLVHPLPVTRPEKERAALMREIGGGAGYDLDALLTLLPAAPGGTKTRALVADLAAGRELLARLPAAELEALRRGYDLAPEMGPAPGNLPALLAAAQQTPRAQSLGRYLNLIAAHLRASGITVDRLPLLLVPTSLLRDPGPLTGEFLLGWNNMVVEVRDGKVRAEGFSSLLPTGDADARSAFARAGCQLDLLPPLIESVVRNGGYRCASNHLRAPARR